MAEDCVAAVRRVSPCDSCRVSFSVISANSWKNFSDMTSFLHRYAWCADAGANQYIEVDLGQQALVNGVIIQGKSMTEARDKQTDLRSS